MINVNVSDASNVAAAVIDNAGDAGINTAGGSLAEIEAEVLSVVTSENEGGNQGINNGAGSGDGADEHGLTFPSFGTNIRETLLVLASAQSEITEDQISLASSQIEKFQTMQADQAEKNIDQLSKMRKKGKKAEFWGDVAKYGGYASASLMMVAGMGAPPLMVAGAAMMTTMVMNETGTTEKMINGLGGGAEGTAAAGGIMLGASIAAGFAGGPLLGATMFVSLAPGMLASQENIENMGAGASAAGNWSLGINIAFSLVAGFGMAKMGTLAARGGSTAANTGKATAEANKTVGKAMATMEEFSKKMSHMNKFTMFSQCVVDISTATATGIRAKFTFAASRANAKADRAAAIGAYAGARDEEWTGIIVGGATKSFGRRLTTTDDIIDRIHFKTKGHQNA